MAVVYAATAFVVVQAASFVFPALLLPDVVLRALAVLALVGVGAYRAAVPGSGGSGAAGVGNGDEAAAADGAHADAIEAVAVLPFRDLSAGSDQQYFGDGLAEEIIDALTRVKGLRVASRTSSFRFRGDRVDPRAIADTLGVDAIVEGSVRRAGDRLRVTAQLIDADDAFHRWSRTFERELTADNLFDVQEEIARGVVEEMRREEGGPAADRRLVRRPGTGLDSYDLYLRARFHWNRRTPPELVEAVVTLFLTPHWAMIETGREERLLDAFERIVESRDLGGLVVDLAADPVYEPIRSHPRYRALLRRVNLAP